MLISVVVPAYNEERLLGATLQAINKAVGAFRQRGWQSELIVCDNNSKDATPEIARQHGATVVFEPINQIGRARNAGAAAAEGEWLIFVDADSLPNIGLFRDVADQILTGKYIAGGSTIRLDGGGVRAAMIMALWNNLSRCFHLLAGSFIFCEAGAFREAGGFNLELFVTEELELTTKLKRVARNRRKKLAVLTKNPLLTSARKMHLYSTREHLSFLLRAALRPGKMVRNREACHPWYDGRR